MKKQKYFWKLLAVFLFIVTVYTLIASVVIYYKNNQIIAMQMENGYNIFFRQQKDKIDTKLLTAVNLIKQLYLDSDMLRYSIEEQTDYQTLISIVKTMSAFQVASLELGFSTGISKVTDNRVVYSRGTVPVNEYLDGLGIKSLRYEDIINFLNEETEEDAYFTVDEADDNSSITVVRKLQMSDGKNFIVLMTFGKKSLLPSIMHDSNEAFAILTRDQLIGMKADVGNPQVYDLFDQGLKNDIRLEKSEFSVINKDDYRIQYAKSDVLDWYYIYATPKGVLQNRINRMLIKSLVIFAVLVVAGLCIAFFITKKIYKPILDLLSIFKGYDGNGGKDEFTLIKDATAQIRKANESLREIIQNHGISLREKFLRDLLLGILTKDDIMEGMEHYGLKVLDGKLAVAVVEITNFSELESSFLREAILDIKSQTLLIISQQVRQSIQCEMFELDYRRYVIIMDGSDISRLEKILEYSIRGIGENFEISMVSAIGTPVESPDEVFNSFNNALYLLEHQNVCGNKLVITQEDIRLLERENYYYPLNTERELINCVVRGKGKETNLILKRIIDENFRRRKLGVEVVSKFIFSIAATVNRILQVLNRDAQEFFEDDVMIFLELKMYDSEKQLEYKIIDIFNTIVSRIESENDSMNNSLADEMLDFIHNNYDKDVSLVDVAEQFKLSSGYVSFLFKKETGENFKDYVNSYRINKAKEILTQRNLSVKKVAELMGCNNTNTFIRMFKKYEGVSPGQYVRQIRQ